MKAIKPIRTLQYLSCLAMLLLAGSTAHAQTASLPKVPTSGSNLITIGYTRNLLTNFNEVAMCVNGTWQRLTTSAGTPILLGASGELTTNLTIEVFGGAADQIRRPVSTPSLCGLLQPAIEGQIKQNGYRITMKTGGGNDYLVNFNYNSGGPMTVYAGAGDDTVLVEEGGTSSPTYVYGEDGADQIGTYGWGNDTLNGGAGNDFLTYANTGSNTCSAGTGTDKCSNTCTPALRTSCESLVSP